MSLIWITPQLSDQCSKPCVSHPFVLDHDYHHDQDDETNVNDDSDEDDHDDVHYDRYS